MKNNCKITKDLMPLVIDGVASDESKQYVDDHIAECTECAIAYGSLRVELPLAKVNAEKERAEMEKAAKKLRRKRILRGVLGALLAIAIFIGGTFAWKEMEYRLTQVHSQTMALDEYSARLVQTKAGNVIVCINLNGREDLDTVMKRHVSWSGIKDNTKNLLEIEMLKTPIPQYLSGDDANIQKMLRVYFGGSVVDGEWYNVFNESGECWDEVALVCGDERKVIYTKGDQIPLCSEEMEAYYEAYHEEQPAGKTYPEWRVDLVKLLDATPEMKSESDEEYQELRYVCENGDLKLDALYYDVSRGDSQNSRVQTDIYSFPSGNLMFKVERNVVPVNDGTAFCVQYRAIYAPNDETGSWGIHTWIGQIKDGQWTTWNFDVRDEEGNPKYLPIVRLELHAGDDYVVLWEEGDELQTPAEAKAKREAEEAKYLSK